MSYQNSIQLFFLYSSFPIFFTYKPKTPLKIETAIIIDWPLKEEKSKVELDTAIIFSLEAKNNRDDLQKKLDSLNRDLKIKNAESVTIQSQIDQYRTENESVLSEYDSAQKKLLFHWRWNC